MSFPSALRSSIPTASRPKISVSFVFKALLSHDTLSLTHKQILWHDPVPRQRQEKCPAAAADAALPPVPSGENVSLISSSLDTLYGIEKGHMDCPIMPNIEKASSHVMLELGSN